MPPTPQEIDALFHAVIASEKYADVHPGLVRRLLLVELAKGRSPRETVKAVRNKIHQVGGSYQDSSNGYANTVSRLTDLPADCRSPQLQEFCRSMLTRHASTRERLPILEAFYQVLQPIAPLHSVVDLACGLNPLAIPWMPLAPGAFYHAYDIYSDMLALIGGFFEHIQQPGQAALCDLTAEVPDQPAQLTLLLKTIPCLEQVDKGIGLRLLNAIHSDYLLVTFPAHSLGGRSKGMPQTYQAHFTAMLPSVPWQLLSTTLFASELVFLLKHD